MPDAPQPLPLPLTPAPAFAPDGADARVLHLVDEPGLAAFRAALSPADATWLDATGFAAGLGELALLPGPDGAVRAAVAGLGSVQKRRRQRFGIALAQRGLPPGAWRLQAPADTDLDEITLAWLLAGYRFTRYVPAKAAPSAARLVAPDAVDAPRLLAVAAGEYLTRDLINTPALDLGPEELEHAALSLAGRFGASARVIRGDDLLAGNFPMIHAVGRASTRAPRLIDLRWGERGPRVTLVGKGVCFDTGGLNIKPSSGMSLMKKDMGGAATVLGLAQMLMQTGTAIRLRVLIPAVENAISGNAQRPKDILTSRKGLTVEVNDTDAEGRLVLADALALAVEEETDLVVSMATLTGAARVAVGPDLAPYFTDDDSLAQAIEAGGRAGHDPVWRMPFWDPYETQIEPGIADLDNAPSFGFAGAITAALFLRRFVGPARYAHFDIYGHSPADLPARPKGGAGQGARALFHAIDALARR